MDGENSGHDWPTPRWHAAIGGEGTQRHKGKRSSDLPKKPPQRPGFRMAKGFAKVGVIGAIAG
jgi:hypothetical protein